MTRLAILDQDGKVVSPQDITSAVDLLSLVEQAQEYDPGLRASRTATRAKKPGRWNGASPLSFVRHSPEELAAEPGRARCRGELGNSCEDNRLVMRNNRMTGVMLDANVSLPTVHCSRVSAWEEAPP